MNMTAEKSEKLLISQLLGGRVEIAAADDRPVSGLCLDSRKARPGDLFLAVSGVGSHGLQYVDAALRQGVTAVLWEPDSRYRQDSVHFAGSAKIPFIAVPELSRELGFIADRFYSQPSSRLQVIGITGTDGKTSCSLFISTALNRAGISTGVIGTLGYGLPERMQPATHTTPDALRVHQLLAELVEQQAQSVVMETSSHGLHQGRVNGVRFDIAVLTNVTRDHMDYHGDIASYRKAKLIQFQFPDLRHAVLNLDDEYGREIAGLIRERVNVLGYAIKSGSPEQDELIGDVPVIYCENLQLDPHGMVLSIVSPWGRARIKSALMGRFNASNILSAIGVLVLSGINFKKACDLAARLNTAPGRMEVFNGRIDCPRVIVDYAHTPEALQQVLISVKQHTNKKVWCVFGCGGDRDRGKRAVMGEVASRFADRVIITDDNPRHESPERIVEDILAGIAEQQNVIVEHDRATAIRTAIYNAAADDLVVVAGKGHESYQIVGDEVREFSDREFVRRCLQGGGA